MPSDLFIVNNKNIWSFHLDSFTRPWYKTDFNFIYFVTLALNFLYPSFILHVLEMENVTALCNSEKREPHIEQSRESLPALLVLNFDRVQTLLFYHSLFH